jgi:hypothetical protein
MSGGKIIAPAKITKIFVNAEEENLLSSELSPNIGYLIT